MDRVWELSRMRKPNSPGGGDIFDNDEEEEDLYYFDFDDPEDEEDSLDDGEEEEQEQKVQGRHTSPASVDMIYGIFYARFLPEQGTHIVHQSPPGCITAEPGVQNPPLISFPGVSEFVIPRQGFCNRFVTILDGEYRISGFPVCVKHEKYSRNEFIFNFGIVSSAQYDSLPYEAVVRRLASTFTEMEIQNEYLSKEGTSEGEGRRSIGDLLEIVREDLNNYNECMIPVDEANTINMKLFPAHKDPPPVKSWHVPVAKIKLADIVDDRWDLTLKKIIPHIDGVNDVRRIALEADVSLDLTKIALQHLLFYQTILIMDMFLFSNIYSVTPSILEFFNDDDGLKEECLGYVSLGNKRSPTLNICHLYASLSHGRTLREWLSYHMQNGLQVMDYVDIRRFIQFGIIKGYLKRVHKYAVSSQYVAGLASGQVFVKDGGDRLQKYTDGCHSFDQIIVENDLTDVSITKELGKLPSQDVQIVYR